ncbi:MAG: single-stranded DNA-binding protein [Solobacterium sp.]|jgi:single-strand DNA-binding protein|nr:single-stranded DNA-binding protein [Solobacterium sp.]
MINRVVLVGRLTRDVEVRKTQSGLSVASFTVACDRRGSRGQDGQQQTADFISCVAWRQTADFLGQYARKGAMVGVDGRIQTRSYDRDGQKVYTTEVLADSVQLLESRSQSEARIQSGGYQNSYQGGFQDSYQPSYSQPSYSQPSQPVQEDNSLDFSGSSLDISSDDLPF